MKTTITTIESGGRTAAFPEGADLTEFDPADLKTWDIEYQEMNTRTMLQTSAGVDDRTSGTHAEQSYVLAFGLVHMKAVQGPKSSEAITQEFLELVPFPLLTEFCRRKDTSRPLSLREINALKKSNLPSKDTGEEARTSNA